MYVCCSNVPDTFTKIDHVLGHENFTNEYRKVEILNIVFNDHNAIKLHLIGAFETKIKS